MIDAMVKANGLKMEDLIEFHLNQTVEKNEEKEPVLPFYKPLKPNQKWGDVSDSEDENENFPLLSISPSQAAKASVGSYLKVVSANVVIVENKEEKKAEVKKEAMDGFKTAQKKKKQELPVIYSVEEFIAEIRAGRKPNSDFVIDDAAHCEHTYSGTLCPDVRACGQIHLQRCIHGEDCYKKNCPFIHQWDMESEEAENNFKRTMRKYNMLKAGKKVAM